MRQGMECRFEEWVVDRDKRFVRDAEDLVLMEARNRLQDMMAQLERKRQAVIAELIARTSFRTGRG